MPQRKHVKPIIAVLVVHTVIAALTWRDLQHRPDGQVRGSKKLWRIASAANTGGSVAYLAIGRKRS